LSDRDVLAFLVSLAVLLGGSRLSGTLARAAGMPVVAGEIAAGVLLGPTVLGRVAPAARAWLFAPGAAETMLRGYTTVALVALLVVVGLEVDLGIVRRRGRSALAVGVLGFVVPAACGVGLGLWFSGAGGAAREEKVVVALLLAVALGISALPVVARTLHALGLFKSDVGLIVLAGAMIDDLVGWFALALLLGTVGSIAGTESPAWTVAEPRLVGGDAVLAFARTALVGGAFAAALLFGGRRALDATLRRRSAAGPVRTASAAILLGVVGAAATQALAHTIILGGFVAGLAAGRSARIHARARAALQQFVGGVFSPVFFASVGLRVDFASAFRPGLCAAVIALAVLPKVAGCALGSRLAGLRWREATAVGFGMNARGATGVILAELALDARLVGQELFVALVLMAVGTSALSGPAMKALLYRDEPEEDVVTLLRRGAFVSELHATSPGEAIGELVRALGSLLTGKKRDARDAVVERELVAPTGLGEEVAIPHAAIEGLERPLLALGRSPRGIDFGAHDGRPARIVFLLLIPPKAYEEEVRILASIARATVDARARDDLLGAAGLDEVVRALSESARRTRASMRPEPVGSD
jgi:Kef-type K+ transport system membrane component KefB/mannitol/fructose-specific phosphotransferase system IIA component (Ntr-type)